MDGWYEVKLFLQHSLSISMDALHIIVGILVWIAAALILRSSLTNWRPYLLLVAVLIANEAADFWEDRWPVAAMQFGEAAKDVVLTVIVPTILMFTLRFAPWLVFGRHSVATSQLSSEF